MLIYMDKPLHARCLLKRFRGDLIDDPLAVRTNTFQWKTRVATIHQLFTETLKVSAAEYTMFLFMTLLFTVKF